MNDETPYFLQDAETASWEGGVLAWLDWLRYWIMMSCGYVEAGVQNSAPLRLYQVSRRRRHANAYFARCGLSPARNLSPFAAMLPKGLTRAQRLERMSRISVLGRMRFYRMRCANPTAVQRRARARLVCYDHGWWHSPFLSLRMRGCILLPP